MLMSGFVMHFKRRRFLVVAAIAAGFAVSVATYSLISRQSAGELSYAQLHKRTGQIISTFENSTTTIQYGYAEVLDDGRGITAGRAGFTSGTGDLAEVVERYDSLQPNNDLSHYLTVLRNSNRGASLVGLEGFAEVWEQAAEDPQLRAAQDNVYDDWYYEPALGQAQATGVSSAAGKLIILDTIVQHGNGDDPDGLRAIIRETTQKNGRPNPKVEKQWLSAFLGIRRQHLLNAAEPSTREAWRESVSRTHALDAILEQDMTLAGPLHWTVYGDKFQLPAIR